MSAPTEAMVLAAGLGTRMRPLTDDRPKPLITVAGKALIDYTLDRFATAGISSAIVNVHYFPDQIEDHVSARTKPLITTSDERNERLETGGGLKKARPLFKGDAIYCTNTDAIIVDQGDDDACAALGTFWQPEEMDACLLLCPLQHASGYDGAGDFDLDENNRLNFRQNEQAEYVFTGLQIISTALIDEGPDGAFSTKLLWEKALARGRLFGIVHRGDWLHVGDPEGLALAEAYFKNTSS